MSELNWKNVIMKVSKLTPYEKNPRKASKEQFLKLVESITRLGYMATMLAQPDGTVIGGHLRLRALKHLGIKQIEVRIPNRELTPDEFKEALLRDNVLYGEFKEEMLFEHFGAELVDFVGLKIEPVEIKHKEVSFSANPEAKMVHCPECGHSFNRKEKAPFKGPNPKKTKKQKKSLAAN